MSVLPIVKIPIASLRERSRDIKKTEFASLKKLARNMIETMYAANGVGLAAPQIGQNIRLIVITKEAAALIQKKGDLVLVNPVITKKSWRRQWLNEGCLSVPGQYGEIERHQKVTVQARDLSGRMVNFEAIDLLAEVLQHEIDHLNGRLYVDSSRTIFNENTKKIENASRQAASPDNYLKK